MIRPKIKEIGENVDKFKLVDDLDSVILVYEDVILSKEVFKNKITLLKDMKNILLSKEEKQSLDKIFTSIAFKKMERKIEIKRQEENNLLNSITFK
jgi:hypothetical protein